jgi:LmbE family N-acetylglucosaminyl deacetylase
MAATEPPFDLNRACVVVAHPDDEVLWFSSVLGRVGRVLLSFEDCAEYPDFGPARRAVMDDYPLPNVESLRLPEPCSVHLVDWLTAEPDEFGVRLNAAHVTDEQRERYRRSFHALRQALAPRLQGVGAVFTHNPWGEYGHPDHVQLSRVVESLSTEHGFRVFYSGYIAYRTMPLAARHLPQLGSWFELPVQPSVAEPIEALYKQHGAWTWPDDHQRFSAEVFLERADAPRPGSGFRLNCITA